MYAYTMKIIKYEAKTFGNSRFKLFKKLRKTVSSNIIKILFYNNLDVSIYITIF